jgi:flagellar hook-associated protein 1 FlgK
VTLTIGEGRPLVAGDRSYKLETTQTPPLGLSTITLDGQPAVFNEGALAGLQEAIDAATRQIDDLDGLAASVADRVNALHTSGTDLDGNAGVSFFNTAQPVTAANISLNSAIAGDPRLIVASPLAQPGPAGTVAGQIANLMTDPGSAAGTRTGSFSSIFSSMLADAGEEVRSADNDLETQAAILSQAVAQRESISGVSLDEEAISLLQHQKAFEAAARFLKVADEMTQMILSLAQ